MTRRPINDCFLHDKDRLTHHEALELLDERLSAIVDVQEIDAADGLDRILGSAIAAPINVPLHTNSAVDGYAFRHADMTGEALPVSVQIAAGDISPPPLKEGHAARIFTGAPMPTGADTVAMQEDCRTENGGVILPARLKAGANCRLAGEDVKEGETVLEASTRFDAADLAAISSLGISEISVFKKLKVHYFSSGNELRSPTSHKKQLKPGEVFDANAPMLRALSSKWPIDLSMGRSLPDRFDEVKDALAQSAESHDVIITSGGASLGTEDHMLAALDELGSRHMWQIAVKPGRPMMFGQIRKPGGQGDCFYFGLPGNPVAAFVCFLNYVRPALFKLAGGGFPRPTLFPMPAAFSVEKKKPDRREFLRGQLVKRGDRAHSVLRFDRDGSGLISSLRFADGFIVLDEDRTQLKEGEIVDYLPLTEFI